MYTTHSNTQYKNESKHSEMGPVRQNQSWELIVCSYVCASHCAQLLHTILHRRPDSFPPYPPDNHHYSDDVYLREGGLMTTLKGLPKNLSWLHPQDKQMCQMWYKSAHRRLPVIRMKYSKYLFYLYLFLNAFRSDPWTVFLRVTS